jgi:hypothetical protein
LRELFDGPPVADLRIRGEGDAVLVVGIYRLPAASGAAALSLPHGPVPFACLVEVEGDLVTTARTFPSIDEARIAAAEIRPGSRSR